MSEDWQTKAREAAWAPKQGRTAICECATAPHPHNFAAHPDCEYFAHHCKNCHERQVCTAPACGMLKPAVTGEEHEQALTEAAAYIEAGEEMRDVLEDAWEHAPADMKDRISRALGGWNNTYHVHYANGAAQRIQRVVAAARAMRLAENAVGAGPPGKATHYRVKSSSEHVDRSFSALLERARKQVSPRVCWTGFQLSQRMRLVPAARRKRGRARAY